MAIPLPTMRKGSDPKIRKNFEEQINAQVEAARKRRELWHALNQFISDHNGFLISPPHAKQLLIETPRGAGLAEQLTGLGFQLRYCGTNTRTASSGFFEVDCFSFIPVK
jgi:hypothetical protein